jgi:hypothetical protein
VKTQTVRLIDLFFIAPYLLIAATKPRLSKTDRAIVIAIAAGTFYYNAINYLKYETKKTA